MPKRSRLLPLCLPVLLAPAVVAWALWPGPGITRVNFGKIRAGMTERDVEDLLGCPAGDYREGEVLGWRPAAGGWQAEEITYRRSWFGNDLFIHVQFDESDRVVGAFAVETWSPNPPPVQRLRHWLGLGIDLIQMLALRR
jgi:hypothetical protein